MLEKAENIAVVILIAFLVMQCVYTVKDGINTHNDYKNSVLVEAEVLEVFGYEKDEASSSTDMMLTEKLMRRQPYAVIRVSNREIKKQSGLERTVKKSSNTTLNRKESGMI